MEQLKEQTEQFINDWKEAFPTMDRRVFESELLSLLETAMSDAWDTGYNHTQHPDEFRVMNHYRTFRDYFSKIKETLTPLIIK